MTLYKSVVRLLQPYESLDCIWYISGNIVSYARRTSGVYRGFAFLCLTVHYVEFQIYSII